MNEEEVIEKIEWAIKINIITKKTNGDNASINVKVLQTVLNLLEKKEEKIEEYKMLLAKMHGQFLNSDIKSNKKHREDLETLNEGWKLELEKKEKIIDLMSEKLNQAYFEEYDFDEWFEEKICPVQQKIDYGYVADIIKQYFEKKVER